MWWKLFAVTTLFAIGLVLGMLIASTDRPEVNVVSYSPANRIPPVERSTLTRLGGMTPLVEAGPFLMAFNPRNEDYLIEDLRTREPLVHQQTTGDQTSCDFFAKQLRLVLGIKYRKNTSEVVGVEYAIGGITDAPKYTYMDTDGDGQFDSFIDYETRVVYERKGLQWVQVRRFSPEQNPGR